MGTPSPVSSGRDQQRYTPVYFQNYAQDSAAPRAAGPTPIQSGDITVSATVTITYLIA